MQFLSRNSQNSTLKEIFESHNILILTGKIDANIQILSKIFPYAKIITLDQKFQFLSTNCLCDLVFIDESFLENSSSKTLEQIKHRFFSQPVFILTSNKEKKQSCYCELSPFSHLLFKPLNEKNVHEKLEVVLLFLNYKRELILEKCYFQQYQNIINENFLVSKTDPKGVITFANTSFAKTSGYSIEELVGKPHNIIRHPDVPKEFFKKMWKTIKEEKRIWTGIVKNRRKDGSAYYVKSSIRPILDLDNNIKEYIAIRQEISDILDPTKQVKDALSFIADPIIIYMKLENYEVLEEIYTKEKLEEIEENIAYKIEKSLKKFFPFEELFHFHHGEYIIIMHKTKYFQKYKSFKDLLKILRSFQEQFHYQDIYDIPLLISVVFEGQDRYESARLGIKKLLQTPKRFIVANNFFKKQQLYSKNTMEIIKTLHYAIENRTIFFVFQPIVSIKNFNIAKHEVLLRIKDKAANILFPFQFLDIAKKSGLYTHLSLYLFDHIFSYLDKTKQTLSINISAKDIELKEIRKKIQKGLHQYDGKRITFEIVEQEEIDNIAISKFLHIIANTGSTIALDDFGSGYANFHRIQKLNIQFLKIDGSLIRAIPTSPYAKSIVKTIVTFAKDQNIQTVAEFVENETLFDEVRKLRIDYAQGYFFGKPSPTLL